MVEKNEHVAATSARELAPVNTALILTTSICTGGLTVLSELLGKSADRYAFYILGAVWLLAILLCVALIGREDKNKNLETRPAGNWLARWTACTVLGAKRVTEKWAYSLLLLAMATLGGTTSYLNFKRAHSESQMAQARPAGDGELWMRLHEGNVKAVELELASGSEDLKYINPMMGNALEGLMIKGGKNALKMLDLVPPLKTDLNQTFKNAPMYDYTKLFPAAWGEDMFTSLGIRMVDKIPKSMDENIIYMERNKDVEGDFRPTALMLAIWSKDVEVVKKLLSLGADPAIPTTFKLFGAKLAPKKLNKGSPTFHSNEFWVTLYPSNEAKRLGGAVATLFPVDSKNQMQSSIRSSQ